MRAMSLATLGFSAIATIMKEFTIYGFTIYNLRFCATKLHIYNNISGIKQKKSTNKFEERKILTNFAQEFAITEDCRARISEPFHH